MTCNDLPAPLVPADVDLRDFEFMPLDVARLRDSEISALEDAEAFRAAVISWCVAWHQVPAASLPDDDGALCKILGYGRDMKTWRRLRGAGALRGWVQCADGRLYHRVVAEKALEAWIEKLSQRLKSGAGNAKRWGVEFDPANLNRSIADSMSMLASLNPQSRALAKRKFQGVPQAIPQGQQEASHKDRKGQGQGQGQGQIDTAAEIASGRDPIREALDSIGAWDDPNLHIHGARVLDWLRQGADLDLDVIPTLKTVLGKARVSRSNPAFMPTSLNFFDRAIADAVEARTRPLPAGDTHDHIRRGNRSDDAKPKYRNGFVAIAAEEAGRRHDRRPDDDDAVGQRGSVILDGSGDGCGR